MQSPIKPWLVSILVALVALEIGLRLFFPQTLNVYQYDEDYLFAFRPSAEITYTSPEFSQVTRFNSHGFRDHEYAYARKPAGITRVLMLGDSFVVGLEVALHETFAKRLEQKLRDQLPERNIEVLGIATNGWSTEQELLFLEKHGLLYDPDLVILAYYVGNDQIDNAARNLLIFDGTTLSRPAQRPLAHTRLRSVYYFLSSYSHTFNFFMFAYWKMKARLGKPAGIDYGNAILPYLRAEETPEVAAAWQKSFALLDRMRAVLSERDIPLVLLLIPDKAQETPSEGLVIDKPQQLLTDYARARQTPVIDLLPAFQATNETVHYAQDFHWNPAGHALAAEAATPPIANFIKQRPSS